MDDDYDDLFANIQVPEDEPTISKIPKLENNKATTSATGPQQLDSTVKTISSHCVLVNPKQKGNPLLKSIRNVPWELDDIIPDYVMGPTTCAMFLSIRYHNMNPDYIHERLKALGKSYTLRILLVQVDVPDPHIALKNLTRICLLADLTLMLAWNADEAGKVIETYKIYENKPPDKIMEKVENDPHQKITSALTSIKPVNKTDAMTLLSTFGTLENIIKASETKLSSCPGFGTRKASKLYNVLHEPFLKKGFVVNNKPSPEEDICMEQIDSIIKQHEENEILS